MRTRLFRCTDCDLEVRLQAWKAVCPRCGKQYTLVPVEGRLPKASPTFAYASAALLIASGLAAASSSVPYWGVAVASALLASVAVLTRSLGGHLIGASVGLALGLLFGVLISTNPVVLVAGLASSALSVYDEIAVSGSKRRLLELRSH
ncbi:MAG: hypothetical protein N3H32_02505 [Nitrososphaeria archaeon]|nr:hypothetical protein [Nitrososphaeria archaeon]